MTGAGDETSKAVLQLVCGISGVVQYGFFFHPSDQDLSLGAPA
jgi:hypothetical protein